MCVNEASGSDNANLTDQVAILQQQLVNQSNIIQVRQYSCLVLSSLMLISLVLHVPDMTSVLTYGSR